jgi:hypothetical protein
MKPSCPVLNPMTQMIRLLTAASTQPVQHLLPIRIVEKTVSTQDKQSSRHTSESTSNLISSIFTRKERLVPRSKEVRRNLRNLGLPVRLGVPYISESEIQLAPPGYPSNDGRRALICCSHATIWFQLAKAWATSNHPLISAN